MEKEESESLVGSKGKNSHGTSMINRIPTNILENGTNVCIKCVTPFYENPCFSSSSRLLPINFLRGRGGGVSVSRMISSPFVGMAPGR